MNIDIDHFRRHIQLQEGNRITAHHHDAPVGFTQRMLQRTIANRAAVQEQVLHPVVGPIVVRFRRVATQPNGLVTAFDPEEIAGQIVPKKRPDPLGQIRGRGQIVQQLRAVP